MFSQIRKLGLICNSPVSPLFNKRRHESEMQLILPRFEQDPSQIQVIIQLACLTKVIFSTTEEHF